MADPLRSPEGANARREPDPGAPSGRSRWVVALVIALAIALLGVIVFLHLSGTIGPGVH